MLLCHLCLFFSEVSLLIFCLHPIRLFAFYRRASRVLCTFQILVLCQICALKPFSACLSLSFQPLNRISHRTKVFLNFDEVQITIFFFLWIVVLVSSLKTLCLFVDPVDFLPAFFSKLSIVLHFTFKSMVNVE